MIDKKQIRTNGDRIRSSNNKELAELFNMIESDGKAYGPRGKNSWLEWLDQEEDVYE